MQPDSVSNAPPPAADGRGSYWRKTLRVSAVGLAVWFFTTFVLGYFARELSFELFGWPFSFWLAAQGALIVYVLLSAGYARYMNRLDREHGPKPGP